MTGPLVLAGPFADLDARIRVPPSKSLTNRAIVAAAVAGGGRVARPLDSDDTRHLADAIRRAGWPLDWGREIEVARRSPPPGPVRLDLRDSGTGARFALALAAALPGRWTVDGSERLRERPMAPLLEALRALGVTVDAPGDRLPATVDGRPLAGGAVSLRPEVSSQFVSALLMAAPLMTAPLELSVTGPVPSRPYLDLTEEVLRAFGASVERDARGARWRVSRGDMRPGRFDVEGDWSAAAFFLAAAAVSGGRVRVAPLDPDSRQGDRLMASVLAEAGVEIERDGDGIIVRGPVRRPVAADLRDAPDLFPALAVVAATGPPGARIRGVEHLRHKESDRLAVMWRNLERAGATLAMADDAVVFAAPLARAARPTEVEAAGDHRIAMAMAVAALRAGPLLLDDPSVVSKSFPGFWGEWDRLVATGRAAETGSR